ncbi:MAG: ATP-binding protein, partial [Cyanobacteria bacterium J06598_1]
DHSRFKQVLLNVISNAIKFTEKGAITISVTTDEDEPILNDTSAELYMPSGPWVKIAVQDSGIGIDPKHLSKLFKPFVMVDGSRTRAYEGTGLGLAISQNFMRLMQGDITIYSEGEGRGSTVTIVVPRVATADSNVHNGSDSGEMSSIAQAIASDIGVAAVQTRQ